MTQTEFIMYNGKKSYRLNADNGKTLVRISDGARIGSEISLGYLYYLNGKKLATPKWETPSDYREEDLTEEEKQAIAQMENELYGADVDAVAALASAKEEKIAIIDEYDKSASVNGFMLNGNLTWIPRDTRISLMNSTQIEIAAGRTSTTLWFDGLSFTFSCQMLIQLLSALELYALQAYNVTEGHKANVRALSTISEVMAYRHTDGYPERLVFNV